MGFPLQTDTRMTAEEFMLWYSEQPDGKRYELLDGVVHEMQGERTIHVRTKMKASRAVERSILERGLPCEALIDGMAVRVDAKTIFEPDLLVRCGPLIHDEAILVLDPVIVVEVVSPSSQRVDVNRKFLRYFNNPSILHYLILDPMDKSAIHHQRMPSGRIETQGFVGGMIRFDPPGIDMDLDEVMGRA